jgi:hypothetical protein
MPDVNDSEHPPLTWGGHCPYCGQPVATPPDPLGELEHN